MATSCTDFSDVDARKKKSKNVKKPSDRIIEQLEAMKRDIQEQHQCKKKAQSSSALHRVDMSHANNHDKSTIIIRRLQ